MAAHKARQGWRGGLVSLAVAVLLTVEGVVGFVFLVVLVEIARSM